MSETSIDEKSPDIVTVANSVEIIDDLFEQPSVATSAGRVGMLLQGESAHVHVIEQPPWLHLGECGHPGESVVLTLAGEWVVSSQGERHHLTPGSIFWFGSETVAGFEVPFSEPATILFFKSEKPRESPETFVEFLVENTNVSEDQYDDQEYSTFDDLPPDHPAIEFARSVNEDLPERFQE